MTTIYDVAREAGVSPKTVSRVINHQTDVSPATAAGVREAIASLGYRPNAAARHLRTGAPDTIGVVVDALDDPFFAAIVSVVEERAVARGMDVLVGSTANDARRVADQTRRLLSRGVDGLLLAPAAGTVTGWRTPREVPIVLIDRTTDLEGLDLVHVDDRGSARGAVEHLLSHGHERVGFVGDSEGFVTVRRRLDGYREALAGAGLPVQEALVITHCFSSALAEQRVREMVDGPAPPTAIFASTPLTGIATIEALSRTRRRDIALVVFGDFPLAGLLEPAVTVVDQRPRALAQAAAERLFLRIDGSREKTQPPATEILLDTTLVQRGSGELAPPEVPR